MRSSVESFVQPESRPRAARWRTRYVTGAMVGDVLGALIVGVLVQAAAPARELGLLPALWPVALACGGVYSRRRVGVGFSEIDRILRSSVALLAATAVGSAVGMRTSGGALLWLVPVLLLSSLIVRAGLRARLRRRWGAGTDLQRAVIVGSVTAVEGMVRRLNVTARHGVRVVGACMETKSCEDWPLEPGLLVGGPADLPTVVNACGADLVIFLPSAGITGEQLRRLAWQLEQRQVEVAICSGLIDTFDARLTMRPLAGAPVFSVAGARLSGPDRRLKHAADRVLALLGLVLIAPMLIAIGLAIWLHDGASPFFRQTRVGIGGQEFRIWKFRSMVVDAEQRRAALEAHNDCDGTLFKMTADPRVTRIGQWLRRFSVDEVPQLINVLRGEMSLVGPRPPLPSEVADYGPDMRRRLLVRPGMTGLWQVSGRSALSWAQTEALDISYVENWSLGLDLLILWITARALLGGAGAY
jgi:exopolysaccharide biosynthesis polyprenyl glycosylphosphotransferase